MDGPGFNRWLPAFIIRRWGHLLWLLPLLCLGFAFLRHKDRFLIAEEASFSEIEEGEGDPSLVARNLAFLEKWQAELKARFAGLW